MKFLHYEFNIGPEDTVEVELDSQANVVIMDDSNFSNYKSGRAYNYYGGLAKKSPVHLSPPHRTHWNLVIDLGGYGGSVNASVNVRKSHYA